MTAGKKCALEFGGIFVVVVGKNETQKSSFFYVFFLLIQSLEIEKELLHHKVQGVDGQTNKKREQKPKWWSVHYDKIYIVYILYILIKCEKYIFVFFVFWSLWRFPKITSKELELG